MTPPNLPTGKPYSFLMNKERPSSRQNPLKVNKESHKITKNNPPLPKPQNSIQQIEEPRIIYTVPQRVIHVAPHDFKDVIQRLTGTDQPTGVTEVISPAARLASTERTSPEKKERSSWSNGDDDMMRMLDNGVQMSQFPGILLPEPAVLPPSPSPYENFVPPVLPQMQYNSFLSPVLPQKQYNSYLPPTLPQIQNNSYLPATLPQIQHNNFLPATLPPFSQANLPPVPSDTFLKDTWQRKPSDILSQVTLPQSDIFLPERGLPSDIFSPVTLPSTQSGNFLPNNWKPSDILLSDTYLHPDTFSPSRMLSTQSDNLLPDNWSPSHILRQSSDIFSPVTLPPKQSDIRSADKWSPSKILSQDPWSPSDILPADTWQQSDILSPATFPSAQSDTFSTEPWKQIESDIFRPLEVPPTPSDTGLSSDTFSPETILQRKRNGIFSPVLGPQSQTGLSYPHVWRKKNNVFAKPPEFIPADVVPPQRPSNQFNSYNYN